MKDIQKIHTEAMHLAEEALAAKFHNKPEKVNSLLTQAYELEHKAAMMAFKQDIPEPSKSILLRSAASLAIDCKKLEEAEKLLCLGLYGNPPNAIKNELRDLFEQVNFARHLELKGITLTQDEIQLSITGSLVNLGMAPLDGFMEKVVKTEKLITRTAERKLGKPFRRAGKPEKTITDAFAMFISMPRAASFAVSFKFGKPNTQSSLPLEDLINIPSTIDDFFDCLELFNNAQFSILYEKINESSYFNNFIGLAKELAPDGKEIKQVGFTSIRNGSEKTVAVTRKKEEVDSSIIFTKTSAEELEGGKESEVRGELRYADSTKPDQEGQIKLITDDDKMYSIIVPEGMMDDIVRPMWGKNIIIKGKQIKKKIYLKDIKIA